MASTLDKLARELGISPEDLKARIATPATPVKAENVAAAHWRARDVACPRACGRVNFRTIGGAASTHRNPAGGACKA